MPTVASRVLQRYLTAVRIDNGMNSTYYTLRWNATKWFIQEYDEPQKMMVSFGDPPQKSESYEMPTLFKQLSWGMTDNYKQIQVLNLSHEAILRFAPRQGEDRGPELRAALIKGYELLVEQALREGGDDPERDRIIASLFKKYRGKLKWKKIG